MFIKGVVVYETFDRRKTATYDREREKKTKKTKITQKENRTRMKWYCFQCRNDGD